MNNVVLNNGVEIPQIGLGVFRILDERLAADTVRTALENGYRHLDTAAVYKNEKAVGRGIVESKVPREEIFITSKVWNDRQREGKIEEALDDTLRNMGLDYVDMYLIHWPVPGFYLNTWKEMEKLYARGKIRAMGVSNFRIEDLKELEAISGIVPVVNQIELQPYFQQEEMVRYCAGRNIKVEAWGPFTAGQTGLFEEPVLVKLAKKYGKVPAQIVLRWDIQRGIIPLPKSSNPSRQKANLNVFDFELTKEEMKQIAELDRNQRMGRDPINSDF